MDVMITAAVPGACVSDAAPGGGAPTEGADDGFTAMFDAAAGDAAESCRSRAAEAEEDEDLLSAIAASTLFGIAPLTQAKEWGFDSGAAMTLPTDGVEGDGSEVDDDSEMSIAGNAIPQDLIASSAIELSVPAGAAVMSIAGAAAATPEATVDTTDVGNASPAIDVTKDVSTPPAPAESMPAVSSGAAIESLESNDASSASIDLDTSKSAPVASSVESATADASEVSRRKTDTTGLERAIASVSKPKGSATTTGVDSASADAPGARVAVDALQRAMEARHTDQSVPVVDPASTIETAASQGNGSIAARLARALERASAGHASERVSSIAAVAEATAFGQASSQQHGGDERSMPESAATRIAIARLGSTAGGPFTIAAPPPFDLRAIASGVGVASQASPASIPERDVVAQLVQSMRLQFRDGIGEAVVHLKPEHLGAVSVSLRIENGAVSASVHAGVAAVRQWLESHQEQLRDSLADQGLRLERFVVEPDGKRQDAQEDARDAEHTRRRRSQHRSSRSADESIFEVVV